MSQLNILISGAGIAGSTLAYWLARAGSNITIIERAPEIRDSGLGVDIRGPAVEVIRRMGLEKQVRSRTTGEEGLAFVDSQDRTFAFFGIDLDNLESSPTSEIEIMRSDLAKLINEAALSKSNVNVQFGTTVEAVSQDEERVEVRFSSGKTAQYDMVIAADGLGSSTRKLLLGDNNNGKDPIRSLGQYTAYFTLPREERDGMVWKWYNAPKSRILSTRPKSKAASCAYLTVMPKDDANFRTVMKQSTVEQKKVMVQVFADAGWQTPRLLAALEKADDFYLQHIAQVRQASWHAGRCAVVGDAAYSPSPLSGVGTSLAILGAYVLAGEIVKGKHNHRGALEAYEEKLRGYVEKKQSIPPGVPGIVCPSSALGVSVLNWIVWFVGWSGVTKWFGGGGGSEGNDGFMLPLYDFD